MLCATSFSGACMGEWGTNGYAFDGHDLDGWRREMDGGRASEPEIELPVIDPRDWQGRPVPQREWVVDGLVPARTVTLLSGDGAAGKSTLMLHLAVTRCIRSLWLGIEPTQGRTLVLSCEDDADELHRRLAAICVVCGCQLSELGDLILIDRVGADAVLGAPGHGSGKIEPTPVYAALDGLMASMMPDLLILDSLPDVFAGSEIDRQAARQFIGILKALCRKHGATVIVISHPSLSGMASGTGTSGSTAWSNSVRSRLYFETEKGSDGKATDSDVRVLTTKKSNYGPTGGQIRCRYASGSFVPIDDGAPVDRATHEARAADTFLRLLKQFNATGQKVSLTPSSTYAPTRFIAHPDCSGVTKAELADAMQRLLGQGRIRSVSEGPPSRTTTRLIVVDGEGA